MSPGRGDTDFGGYKQDIGQRGKYTPSEEYILNALHFSSADNSEEAIRANKPHCI